MDSAKKLANALADAFCEARLVLPDMHENAARLFTKRERWIKPLAQRVINCFGHRTPPARTVAKFIVCDAGFLKARHKHRLKIHDMIAGRPPAARAMRPIAAAASWSIPPILSASELAGWLEVSINELLWFADLNGRTGQDHPLSHYCVRLLQKVNPSDIRCIEAPKSRLKAIQRKILESILNPIPVHETCHGFRRGRSIQSFAAEHASKRMVLKLDLKDFFPSIASGRIHGLFHSIGYPEHVSRLLTGLCTTRTPSEFWQRLPQGKFSAIQRDAIRQKAWSYDRPHLPQGAPTSPMLANLCAYRLDCRLAGLARSASATYTRYADDLAFSGNEPFARKAKHFLCHVQATVMEEGFHVHFRKTRLMRQGVQQRLAGLIVNQRPNVSRRQRDALKAILTNCIRLGPESQNFQEYPNFREYLLGRISFVESTNLAHGEKLRDLFEQIEWEAAPDNS